MIKPGVSVSPCHDQSQDDMDRVGHLLSQLTATKTLHSPMELDAPLDSSDNLSVDGRDTPEINDNGKKSEVSNDVNA